MGSVPRKSLGLLLFFSACLSAPLDLQLGAAGQSAGGSGGDGGSNAGGGGDGGNTNRGGVAGFPAGGGSFGGGGFPGVGGGFAGVGGGFAGVGGGFAGFPAGGSFGGGGFPGVGGGFAGFPAGGTFGRGGFPGVGGGFAGFPAGGSFGGGGFPVTGGTSSGGTGGIGAGGIGAGGTGGTSFPSMVIVFPTQVNFGELPIGSRSSPVAIRITNVGKGNAGSFRFDRTGSSNFGLDVNTCKNALPPGASCEFLVTFSVKDAGAATGTVVLSDKLGTSVTVTLTGGKGPAGTNFTISPSSWDFGEDGTDVAVTKIFTLYNNGTTPISRPEVKLGNPMSGFTFVSECGASLAPGGSCGIRVSFISAAFSQTQYSTLDASAAGGEFTQAFMTGRVRVRRGIMWSETFHDFGTIPEDSAPSATFFLRPENGAQSATVVTQVTLDSSFTILSDKCTGFVLQAGSTCSVTVSPNTSQQGPRTQFLTAYNNLGAMASVSLSANVLPRERDPIGYWQFDEGAGFSARDNSGNNNTAFAVQGLLPNNSVVQFSPEWVPGRFGAALGFNGKDKWVRIEPSDSLTRPGIANAVSFSAWVNVRRYNSTGPSTAFIQQHIPGTRLENFFLGLTSGTLSVGINFFYGSSFENFPLNRWTHVAMTYDGVTQCGFVDGNPTICQDVGWPLSVEKTPFTIGGGVNEQSVSDFLDGAIDEVRLFDVKLDEAEVSRFARQ